MGSGPYKIKSLNPGKAIAYERVPNYWGKTSQRRGSNNFDVIEFQYYGDRTVSLEAFKAGHYDLSFEGSAKNWATGYDFPAVQDGRVVKRSDIVLERSKPRKDSHSTYGVRNSRIRGCAVR